MNLLTDDPRACAYPYRLLLLADLLAEDAANEKGCKFALNVWTNPSGSRASGWPTDELGLKTSQIGTTGVLPAARLPEISCGTSACAMGLAMLSRRFEQFGLGATYYYNDNDTVILIPTFGDYDGFAAAALLFGISEESAEYLFDPDRYRKTPRGAEGERLVEQRIRDFAAGEIDEEWHPGF